MTKALLLWPKVPETFWGFKHALKFINKKASQPPLGLITVASLLPQDWELKLVDMNVSRLRDKDIEWADTVLISAMLIQKDSVDGILERTKKFNKKIIVGGPLFSTGYEEYFDRVDHFVLNEAEVTLPPFLKDLALGKAKKLYTSEIRPDLKDTPPPRLDLIKIKKYANMSIQYSRGCPFNCDFCDIIIMNGRIPRAKTKEQILAELDALYAAGWRDTVFIVDDNFIGNKSKVKKLLPYIIKWSKEKKYPFTFHTEASINLAADDTLLDLMVRAGFTKVFLGIETPEEDSLKECSKYQNTNINLIEAVKKIQNAGLEVMGGFIVGFDSDNEKTFRSQIRFIQKAGIGSAMVGLLSALPRTKLYERLKKEGRLLMGSSGNNTDGSLNFVPKMSRQKLIDGYNEILKTIYHPKEYYRRIKIFLKQYKPKKNGRRRIRLNEVMAMFKSMWIIGLFSRSRFYYWRLFVRSIFMRKFGLAITHSIYGHHYYKMMKKYFHSQR